MMLQYEAERITPMNSPSLVTIEPAKAHMVTDARLALTSDGEMSDAQQYARYKPVRAMKAKSEATDVL